MLCSFRTLSVIALMYDKRRKQLSSVITSKKGNTLIIDLSPLANAISKAFSDLYEVDSMICLIESDCQYSAEEQECILTVLNEKRETIVSFCKRLVRHYTVLLRTIWSNRNIYASRSTTSSISDLMSVTIPTPPTRTFSTENRRGWVGFYKQSMPVRFHHGAGKGIEVLYDNI